MSVSELDVRGAEPEADDRPGSTYASYAEHQVTSPFPPVNLYPTADGRPAPAPAPTTGQALLSPFSESLTAEAETELETQAAEALLAELDDEGFHQALQALADEVAGRHLRSIGTWSNAAEAPVLATADSEQWMESVAVEADRLLGELQTYFGDRPADTLRDGEMEAIAGLGEWEGVALSSPIDAQEQFFKSLLNKAKNVVQGVAKVAKKGLAAVGKLLPIGKLFDILRKLVRPLLKRVLDKAIGRLPEQLRPLATQLAKRFTGETTETTTNGADAQESFAETFDRQLAEAVLAPNETVVEQLVAEAEAQAGDSYQDVGAVHELDVARARLARELAEAVPDQPPTEQMERFIPVVMGALPLIKLGVRTVGRERVVNFIAGALAKLIQGTVGAQAAGTLSRHIASAGLQLLGLEAENGETSTLGTEALVAAAEDTVRHVMSLPPESLEDELLLESEIQDAFTEAAARHLPASVLRPELAEEARPGVWVMMPRATRPCFRYKKYSRVFPVRITRPLARSVVMAGGETLERRLLDAGTALSWPVDAELEVYELLEGAELGHLAAFENEGGEDVSAAALQFEELTPATAAMLAGNPRLAATGRLGLAGRRGGQRYYRVRVGGRSLHRRRPFALRLDLTAAQPVLVVHLHIGERAAHSLSGYLQRRQMVQVVSAIRRLVDQASQQAMTARLVRMLGRHGITLAPQASQQLAQRLADGMLHAVSQQLPAAAPTLARAAKDPAAGATLTFGFTFPGKDAIASGQPGRPTLTIRPGQRRD
jgi:hypothetical protein